MLGWLERGIEAVAPSVALKRAEARQRIARSTAVRNLYEGATYSRRAQGWRATYTDANAETRIALMRLRSVARDLVRNNAIATRAKTVIANNVIGAGITPTVRAATEARAKQVGDLVKAHFESSDIDADGRHNIYGLQNLAMAAIVESGEVLIRKRIRKSSDGYALPFQLQVLESDFLDTNVDGPLPNGNNAIQGVEFDLRGQRVAYYLFDQHPGSLTLGTTSGFRGRRVSSDFVIHIYRVDRPGQVRGISWFAPVIVRMKDFADFTDAQLLRQKIAACFGAFVKSVEGEGPGIDDAGNPLPVTASGINIETMEPGTIQYMREGEDVSFAQPPQVMEFGPYTSVTMHEIAAGLGVTYESLTTNLEGVNYSSGRMGWLEFGRNIETWRWTMLRPQMLEPVQGWTTEAVAVVTGSSEPFSIHWTAPARTMIDVEMENQASKDAIRNGLSSRSEEVRKRGLDPIALDNENAADNARADSLGLVYDSDPRAVSGKGVSQKPDSVVTTKTAKSTRAEQRDLLN
ncbi:MAG: phage portal protein, partial [Janthinobacterium lividum]